MKRETVIPKKKKRGPASTGKGEPVMVRFRPVQMLALDAWIKRQEDQPSRPEAIRRLVELALAGARPMNPMAAAKASDMAAQQIDRLDQRA